MSFLFSSAHVLPCGGSGFTTGLITRPRTEGDASYRIILMGERPKALIQNGEEQEQEDAPHVPPILIQSA
jgi:hypothetical protein